MKKQTTPDVLISYEIQEVLFTYRSGCSWRLRPALSAVELKFIRSPAGQPVSLR
jgi:hypothetical protein